MLFLAIGVMLWRYYQLYPLAAPLATNDAVLPTFVVTSLTHGAAGFIFSNEGGGWEFPAFWAVALLVQALLGDGAYALKRARA